MEDLRKMFEPVTANSEAVKRIRELDAVPWAIKYIGRRLNCECKKHFKLEDDQGFKLELPWEGQERHVEHNFYDDSTYIHELVVDVHAEGPAKGRIKSVHAHHWDHWHTSSNWQDHSESYSSEVRSPNGQEIQKYQQLLDQWTEGGSDEQINALEDYLRNIALSQNGAMKVCFKNSGISCDPYLVVSFSTSSGFSPSEELRVSLNWLEEALNLSHVRIEALFSPLFRKIRGAGLKTKGGQCLGDEGIWLQYFLNLFDFSSSPELYPYLEDSQKTWLCDLFEECESYRLFIHQDSSIWWRDAWWRVFDLMSVESRQTDNRERFLSCFKGDGQEKMHNEDPLSKITGKVKISSSVGNRKPRMDKSDEDDTLCFADKEKVEKTEFHSAVVNGVKWVYSLCSLGITDYDNRFAVIDINMSEPITDLKEVVVPNYIDGHYIAEIQALNGERHKSWQSIIIDGKGDKIRIGRGAFSGWPSLKKVVFKKEANIGPSAFERCCSLSEVSFEFGTSAFASRSFFECKALLALKFDLKLHFPYMVTIGEFAFWGCERLNAVEITSVNDMTIGASAFRNNIGLKSVEIKCGDELRIEDSAFENCIGLEAIDICYNGRTSFGTSAFQGCTALKFAELKDISHRKAKEKQKVSILGNKCFYGCKSLNSVFLPAMVKAVERDAFSGAYGHIHHDGDFFWFEGFHALGTCKVHHWNWDRIVRYDDNEEMSLSSLLEKLDIPRAKYIELALEHDGSSKEIIDIALGKQSPQSSNRASSDSNDYDEGGIWYDGYYCADATTLEEAETEYWNTH